MLPESLCRYAHIQMHREESNLCTRKEKKRQLGIAECNPTVLRFLVLNNRYSVSPNINKQKIFFPRHYIFTLVYCSSLACWLPKTIWSQMQLCARIAGTKCSGWTNLSCCIASTLLKTESIYLTHYCKCTNRAYRWWFSDWKCCICSKG